jgi:hypothetical protein
MCICNWGAIRVLIRNYQNNPTQQIRLKINVTVFP